MAGRSATVANRNWEEWGSLLPTPPHPTPPHRTRSFYPFLSAPGQTSYNETSALHSNFIGWKLRSFPTYISDTAGRSANSWDSGPEVGRPGGRKNGRVVGGGEGRERNDKDKGAGGQEVSARLLRPFRKSPGMRATLLYRVSLFASP